MSNSARNTDSGDYSTLPQPKPAKWPTVFAIAILLFSILFCIWGGISLFATRDMPVVYWLVAPNIYAAVFIITALGVSFLAVMITRIFRKFWIGFLVLAVVFGCGGLFAFYQGSLAHQDSIAFKGHMYHLALRDNTQWSDYVLCECDSSGILCQCHAFYSRYILGRPNTNTLSIDTTANALRVNAGKDVIYTYAGTPRCFPVDGVCLDK
jgi:hypothetical protein